MRSAFAGTSLFVPLIVCLAILQERGYEEGYRISSARGLTRFNGVLAHVFSSALIIGAAYSALCLLLFAIAIIRGGQSCAHDMLAAFLPAMIINAVLVISVALETVTIYRITSSAVFSGAVAIIGFVTSLTELTFRRPYHPCDGSSSFQGRTLESDVPLGIAIWVS